MTSINKININETEYTLGGGGDGLTAEVKSALMQMADAVKQLASKVSYSDEHGDEYYDDVSDAWDAMDTALNPPASLSSITAVYTQSRTVYDTQSLNVLNSDLVVTAHYSDQTAENITTYVLSGTLTAGTSQITVSYGGKSTTFNVAVTGTPAYPLTSGTVSQNSNKRTVTVSNGNNVVYGNTASATSGTGYYGDISRVSRNSGAGTSSDIFSADSAFFTLPSGSTAVLSIHINSINKKASNDSSVSLYKLDGTSLGGCAFGNDDDTDKTRTITVSEDTAVGVVGLYLRNSITSVDFDVSLMVDDIKYI